MDGPEEEKPFTMLGIIDLGMKLMEVQWTLENIKFDIVRWQAWAKEELLIERVNRDAYLSTMIKDNSKHCDKQLEMTQDLLGFLVHYNNADIRES